jgi:hypothetical protein
MWRNIVDDPLLTEVMKQGLIFKIRSGLAVTSLRYREHMQNGIYSKIIGKILTISLAVAASPPSLPPRSRATAVRVKMVPAWPRKLAVETTSPVCGSTLKRSARSRLYTSSLFSPLSLSRACAQRCVANRVQKETIIFKVSKKWILLKFRNRMSQTSRLVHIYTIQYELVHDVYVMTLSFARRKTVLSARKGKTTFVYFFNFFCKYPRKKTEILYLFRCACALWHTWFMHATVLRRAQSTL